jgi:uncharacterized protein (DUF2252 family)
MRESPFVFYRGAATIMASDLATTPSTGISVQLCGDAHLLNFGSFGTPERNFVFDVNDFDETLPGPFEWDVKRLAASVVLAGRDNGFGAAYCTAAVRATLRSYREHMAKYARMPYLKVHYVEVEVEELLRQLYKDHEHQEHKRAEQSAAKARTHDNLQAFDKLCSLVDGRMRINDDPPLVTHVSEPELGDRLVRAYRDYLRSIGPDQQQLVERYTVEDMALKVVGVGSVGTRCYIVLFKGIGDSEPLVLQVKQAMASVLEPYLGKSTYANHGQRVVSGQRQIQAASDIFLGWGKTGAIHHYIRELRDMKGSVDVATLRPKGLAFYGEICGWVLARAHARSGDPAVISGYLGGKDTFDRATTTFAHAYADQTERDHAALVDAYRDGRVRAPGESG